jgi:hypothetical protein
LQSGQFPTDPDVFLSHKGEDVIFTAHLLGSAEIGTNLFFKAVARKQAKEDVQGEESPNGGDTVDGTRDSSGYQLGRNGRDGKPTKDEL